MPNPAGFFAVCKVVSGQLYYLIDESTRLGRWGFGEHKAVKFISRATAVATANRFPGSGVVARSFMAAEAAHGIPAQRQRAGRPRAALPPSTNRGGKSRIGGAGA